MYSKKVYGQTRVESCPFCNKRALAENPQGVPVCMAHKNEYLDLRCVCKEPLEIKKGKWGPYFHCMNCGNISFNKGMSMNPPVKEKKKEEKKEEPKEREVRSDELDLI
ncbi:MAG: hypothetical protein GY861_06360 [bacterium]|nr:hypothetical protein [bacterium]